MTEVKAALESVKPGVLVEFRQSYVGPAIRKYGNMLRVGDCPGNMRRNRFAMANLRLASGATAVHSDMLEWNYADTPDHAALYIINAMFAGTEAGVGNMVAEGDNNLILKVFREVFTSKMFIVATCCICLWILTEPFI